MISYGLLAAVEAQAARFDQGRLTSEELRSWLLSLEQEQPDLLRQLAADLDSDHVRDLLGPKSRLAIRGILDDLLAESTSPRSDVTTAEVVAPDPHDHEPADESGHDDSRPSAQGESLEERLAAEPDVTDSWQHAQRWLHQLARRLDALHDAGLVHGNVSPANVIITPAGDAMLLEETAWPEGTRRPDGAADLSRAFASPDALLGAPMDRSDDVYSLAALAYRIATGHLPHGREGSASEGHPLPAPAPPAGLAPHQRQALAAALHPLRTRRPASAGEFAAALCVQPVTGRRRPAVRRDRRLNPAAVGLALLGVAAVAAVAAWTLSPDLRQWVPLESSVQLVRDWTPWPAEDASSPGESPDSVIEEPLPASEPVPVIVPEPVPVPLPAPVLTEEPPPEPEPAPAPAPEPESLGELATDTDTDALEPEEITAPDPPEPTAESLPTRYSFVSSQLRVPAAEPAILLPVLREGPLDEAAQLQFQVLPGTAQADEDFVPSPDSTVRFAAGEERALIILPLLRGGAPRGERSLRVRLLVDDPVTAGDVMEVQVTLAATSGAN
jgi:serine/threonine protein kinase